MRTRLQGKKPKPWKPKRKPPMFNRSPIKLLIPGYKLTPDGHVVVRPNKVGVEIT